MEVFTKFLYKAYIIIHNDYIAIYFNSILSVYFNFAYCGAA